MTTRRAPGRRARGFLAGPRIVLALLLVLLALRTINLGVQDAYLDEGFHVRRSLSAWTFSEHPAHFAHGKLLLYYWLGLFTWGASGPGVIVAGRVAIALFSVATGLTVYLLGRRLAGHASGVVALALYAVLPLTLYYERMAMADPLASGLAAVAVLSALGFARRPTTPSAPRRRRSTGSARIAWW